MSGHRSWSPTTLVGAVMELCQKKRGIYQDMQVIDDNRMNILYEMPLGEIIFDFFDRLKSCTKGYASLDYELSEYKESNLVKMDILLKRRDRDALSIIVHRDFAYHRGNQMTQKLKDLIPKHQFEIPVPGRHRRKDHRPHQHQVTAQERAGQVLWR